MPRQSSGKPRKVHYRRAPAWSPELTALVEQCAQLVKDKKIYFTHNVEWGGGVNITGVVQGVLNQAAAQISSITPEQWKKYIDEYAQMVFAAGMTKGIHFDQQALDSFHAIGKALEAQPRPEDVKVKWNLEYHYPLVIAVALQWFVDHYRNS